MGRLRLESMEVVAWRTRAYSINVMRPRHPAWFREDLERLFGLPVSQRKFLALADFSTSSALTDGWKRARRGATGCFGSPQRTALTR